jgi:PAS domain S-box-containing protein
MEVGATMYLTKGEVNPLLLERTIRYAIEIKQRERELREARETAERELAERKRAEVALRKSEANLRKSETKLRAVFEALVEGVVLLDPDGNVIEAYSAIQRQGRTLSELTDPDLDPRYRMIHPDGTPFPEEDQPAILAMRTGQAVRDVELGILQPDGSVDWLLVNAQPVYDEIGMLQGAVASFFNITERKQAEEALRVSEQRYVALFQAKTNGVAHCRVITNELGQPIDYLILQVNEAYEEITGIKRADIEGRRAREVFPGIENFSFDYIGNYGQVALHGGELNFEVFFETTRQWLSIYIYRPKPGEFIAIFTDITQRKQAEEALEKAHSDLINERNRLLAVMEALPVGLAIYDENGGVIQANTGFDAVWGSPRPPANSISDYDLYKAWWVETEERVQPEEWAAAQAVQQEKTISGQFMRIQKFDGSEGFILNSGAPIHDEQGRVIGATVAIMDITKLIEVENALHESQDRFRVAVSTAPLIVYTCDRELRYTWIYNPLRGFRAEDVLGKRDDEVLPPEAAAEMMAAKQMALETGRGGMQEVKVPLNGEMTYYILTIDPIQDKYGNVTGLTCSAIDITNQKRLQMEQQEQAIQIEVQHRLMDQREQDHLAIARDLHDGPIQTLSSTMFHLKMIKDIFPDPELQSEINQLGMDIKNTIHELRNVLNELRPPALITFGFSKVLQSFIEDFRQQYPSLEIELDVVEDDKLLSAQAHLTLFRIFQAGINNIIRHSDASKVWIVFKVEPDRFYFELRDNGEGFELKKDFSHLTREGHFGLVGMKERAEAIGAELAVSSERGKGTTLVVKGRLSGKNLKQQMDP